jgi:hypothetical protein
MEITYNSIVMNRQTFIMKASAKKPALVRRMCGGHLTCAWVSRMGYPTVGAFGSEDLN